MTSTAKYLKHLQLEGKAENTIDTYKYHLVELLVWISHQNLTVFDVKPAHLVQFKEYLLANGKSERTVNAIISCVRGYYDYIVLHELLDTNPVSNLLRIKVPEYRQNRLTDEELHYFYNYINQLQVNARAAFYLLIGSGARVSEIANLTKEDFTFKDGRVSIHIYDAKYGSDRIIPVLHQKAIYILTQYITSLDITSLPAFRLSKRTLQRHAANFSLETGIPFSCHVLRHTYATLLLEKGIPIEKIQYLLGHKSVNITRHYTQSAFLNVDDIKEPVL